MPALVTSDHDGRASGQRFLTTTYASSPAASSCTRTSVPRSPIVRTFRRVCRSVLCPFLPVLPCLVEVLLDRGRHVVECRVRRLLAAGDVTPGVPERAEHVPTVGDE